MSRAVWAVGLALAGAAGVWGVLHVMRSRGRNAAADGAAPAGASIDPAAYRLSSDDLGGAGPINLSLPRLDIPVQTQSSVIYPAWQIAPFDPIRYRGIRNNNPGNIEWVDDARRRWRGMIRADGRYGIFDTAENGIRAIGGELSAAIRKGQRTVAEVIAEWAPPTENNTTAYIAAVAQALGVDAYQAIDIAAHKAGIARAIIKHENGVQPYKPSDIARWVALA